MRSRILRWILWMLTGIGMLWQGVREDHILFIIAGAGFLIVAAIDVLEVVDTKGRPTHHGGSSDDRFDDGG